MSLHWKTRLYNAYVTTGQAGKGTDSRNYEGDPAKLFPPGGVARFVASRIPKDRSARILDLGCGHGALLHHLRRLGYRNLSGVDTSAEQIAIAHQTGLATVDEGDIETHLAGLPNASVDVILLIDVIEHLEPQEMFSVLDDAYRVIKPGGLCIVHVPNAAGISGMDVRYGDFTHEQAFTTGSACQVFSAVGFRRVRCFEDAPSESSAVGLARRAVWELGTLPRRILMAAETGALRGSVLTRNLFVEALK